MEKENEEGRGKGKEKGKEKGEGNGKGNGQGNQEVLLYERCRAEGEIVVWLKALFERLPEGYALTSEAELMNLLADVKVNLGEQNLRKPFPSKMSIFL